MVFTFLGAVAEFERAIIGERVKAGLQAARKRGKTLGRPGVQIDSHKFRELILRGVTVHAAAKQLGLPITTAYRQAASFRKMD